MTPSLPEAISSQLCKRLLAADSNPMKSGVVTIGSFDGKGTFNVIKDTIEIEGDIRYSDDEVQNKLSMKNSIALSTEWNDLFGVTCELNVHS